MDHISLITTTLVHLTARPATRTVYGLVRRQTRLVLLEERTTEKSHRASRLLFYEDPLWSYAVLCDLSGGPLRSCAVLCVPLRFLVVPVPECRDSSDIPKCPRSELSVQHGRQGLTIC